MLCVCFCFAMLVGDLCLNVLLGYVVNGYVKLMCAVVVGVWS